MLKAIVYDFDGTLTEGTVPEFKILEKCGWEGGAANPRFFTTVRQWSEDRKIDIYEAMALLIMDIVQQAELALTDENFGFGADERAFNPGVEELLDKLKQAGVQNFLLSSGLKAYLEQLKIAADFTEIYATVFKYDQAGRAVGIERVMSTVEKAVALQEIALCINGKAEDFSGIVYIGDGPTDVEAMRHIKQYGGKTILIQHEMIQQNLPSVDVQTVDLATKADYRAGGELANFLQDLMTSSN